MLKNYFKTTFHDLRKIKGSLLFKGIGLGIGMLSVLLILLLVNYQYGFNKNLPVTGEWYAGGTKEIINCKEVSVITVTENAVCKSTNKKSTRIKPNVKTSINVDLFDDSGERNLFVQIKSISSLISLKIIQVQVYHFIKNMISEKLNKILLSETVSITKTYRKGLMDNKVDLLFPKTILPSISFACHA